MVFERVICGVDSSPESLEAVRQAERLLAPEGRMLVVGVAETQLAVHAGWLATTVADEIDVAARRALDEARAALSTRDSVATRLIEGDPVSCFLHTAAEEDATLIAVGTHGRGRATGILLGGVATAMLHDANCSVLIARAPRGRGTFPRSVVVGTDGSRHSKAAHDAAVELQERLGCEVRVVVAEGGKPVDIDGLARIPELAWDARKPVDALLAASDDADLVIVGSRGLHGYASFGSVSERVAHEARSSVLVVRARTE
jgi:nucleotide-binding universal stress UspA family protein